MVHVLQGIVLDSFKFKETTVVARIYTREHGLISVMMSGLGKKKSSVSQIYFQPLSLIEFALHHKEKKGGLMRGGQPMLVQSTLNHEAEIKKYAIAMFISEVVLRTTRENEVDESLFELLTTTMGDFLLEDCQDLHLYFLTHYAEVLGFSPRAFYESSEVLLGHELEDNHKSVLMDISVTSSYFPLKISRTDRIKLVRFLLFYLEKSVGMPKIKSLTILEEVFA